MTANRGGDGASPETGVTDLEICKTRCLDNTACLGFDFSKVATDVTRCWLHVTAATWTASATRTNSDQYDRVPCVGESLSKQNKFHVKYLILPSIHVTMYCS